MPHSFEYFIKANAEEWDTLFSEDQATARLYDSLNGRPTLWEKSWVPGAKIRIEWGTGDYIQFKPDSDIFIDRGATNTIIAITEFSTSDTNLADWVDGAGGAIFCISHANGPDSAWGIKPKDDSFFDLGCNSGGWKGRGAFYGDDNYGAGWTGVRDHGEAKAGAGLNLGMTIKMETTGNFI